MSLDEILMKEKAKENIYKILSLLYRKPQEDLLESGLLDNLIESADYLSKDLGSLATDLKDSLVKVTDMEELRIDHAQLFVGPFELGAPPYGSIYLEGEKKIMGDSTIDAIGRYKAAGLNTNKDFKEAPDHIIIELEFLYYLTFNQVESAIKDDFDGALDYLEREREFLEGHLGVWIEEFTAKVDESAKTELYRVLAQLSRSFILLVKQELLNEVEGEFKNK